MEKRVIQYYLDRGITDFPKNSNGLPNMKYKINKRIRLFLMRQDLLNKNKQENKHNIATIQPKEHYRKEVLDWTDEEIDLIKKIQDNCVICGETLKNAHCRLKCDHMFCTSCVIKQSKLSNKCPLCRKEFCDKPTKQRTIDNYLANAIIEHEATEVYQYQLLNENEGENFTTFYNAIEEEIDDFELIVSKTVTGEIGVEQSQTYKEELKKIIHSNIGILNLGIINKIEQYHNEGL